MKEFDDVRLESGGSRTAQPWVDHICELYDTVFSRPPFYWRDDESELHHDRLLLLMTEPSFAITLAWADEALAGFAYGWALGPETHWWSGLTAALPDDEIAEWPGRTFVLFDFAVGDDHRGRGVGRTLHDTLLGTRTEQRATLAAQPVALAAKAMYERWGWRLAGQIVGGATAAAPLFDVYLRDSIADLRRPDQSTP